MITIAMILIGAACLLPFFLEGEKDKFALIIMLSIFILSAGFILWISFYIRYEFHEDYLLVKSGPIRKRIPYSEITSIRPTKDIFTGFRLMSSMDGLAISYRTALMGEIKISPKDKKRFIEELKARVPGLVVRG